MLGLQDSDAFTAHLVRLDAVSRRDRFSSVVKDDFLRRYASRCFTEGVKVVGLADQGNILAAGELHLTGADEGEAAFSVERGMRGKGIGGMLFDRVIETARAMRLKRIVVTTHSNNFAMQRLAFSRGVQLRFTHGEGNGWLEIPMPGPVATQ